MKRLARVFSLSNILMLIAASLVAAVSFILSYKYLPVFNWSYELERGMILFLFVMIGFFLLKYLKWVFLLFVLMIGGVIGYDVYSGKSDILAYYNQSRNVFNDMAGFHNKGEFLYTSYSVFYRDRQLMEAIDFKDPLVRDFAVSAANEFFRPEQKRHNDYERVLIQSLAVFKKINNNWNYVSDPDNDEYFAKASESVKLMAGDCDDYSVLMAAAIKSIGGKVRLTFIKGHIYPELLIGSASQLDRMMPLIAEKLFKKEIDSPLHYYTDKQGNAWINLDYTANYPGGEYMGTDVVEYIYP